MLPPLLCTQAMHYSVNVQLWLSIYALAIQYTLVYYAALVGCTQQML